MRRNKRKNKLSSRLLIIIASIGILSMTGVGYAYWNDSLQTNTLVSTGKIEPVFKSAVFDKNSSTGCNTQLYIECTNFSKTIQVNPVNPGIIGENNVGVIRYTVSLNEKSLPVKLMGFCDNIIPNDNITVKKKINNVYQPASNTFKFELIQDTKVISTDNDVINGILKITPLQKGDYSFEIKLPYKLFINEEKVGPWEEKLTIEGKFSVQ